MNNRKEIITALWKWHVFYLRQSVGLQQFSLTFKDNRFLDSLFWLVIKPEVKYSPVTESKRDSGITLPAFCGLGFSFSLLNCWAYKSITCY